MGSEMCIRDRFGFRISWPARNHAALGDYAFTVEAVYGYGYNTNTRSFREPVHRLVRRIGRVTGAAFASEGELRVDVGLMYVSTPDISFPYQIASQSRMYFDREGASDPQTARGYANIDDLTVHARGFAIYVDDDGCSEDRDAHLLGNFSSNAEFRAWTHDTEAREVTQFTGVTSRGAGGFFTDMFSGEGGPINLRLEDWCGFLRQEATSRDDPSGVSPEDLVNDPSGNVGRRLGTSGTGDGSLRNLKRSLFKPNSLFACGSPT